MRFYKPWRSYLPILHLFIQIPFLEIRTALMHERLELRETEYVALTIAIWRWRIEFRLYDIWERRSSEPALEDAPDNLQPGTTVR